MRRFMVAMVRTSAGLFATLCAAMLLGGCSTVSGLFDRGSAHVSPVSVQVAIPIETPKSSSSKVEPPPVPSPPAPLPVSRAAVAPVPEVLALPGASRLAPPMATGAERIYRDAVLTEDTIWSGEVVVEGSLAVAPQTTLTLEPGAVVRFRRTDPGEGAGPLLLIQGRLVARGSVEAPVRFTSMFPDPQAGEWQGIIFLGSEKKNLLENCRVEGAAAGIDASFSTVTLRQVSFTACGTGGRFQDSIVTISGGGASGCAVGMDLVESESDVRNVVVRGNRVGMAVHGGSLLLEGARFEGNTETALTAAASRLSIAGALFQANGSGIVLRDCEGKVTAARIVENRDVGIHLVRSRVRVFGNEIAANGAIGLRVEDGRGIAWGNAFSGNGRYDIDNAGGKDFRAMANWWGDAEPSIEKRLLHRVQDPTRGRVLVNPVLRVWSPLATLNSVAK